MMQQRDVTLRQLLEEMIEKSASDLHITVNCVPQLRIHGDLMDSQYDQILTPKLTTHLAYSVMNAKQKKEFELNNELDFSFSAAGLSRFRANVFRQKSCVAMVIRQIPYKISTLKSLGLPGVVSKFATLPSGLVLVTGPTGSGKSTTLAAIIDLINTNRSCHILTIEDPIEFVHKHKKSIVNQREINSDTFSFEAALRSVLRQDPDVILIGEMRDLTTIKAAITIAETGHLAFGTLHTNSTAESIHRILDVFPSSQQAQISAQLSFVLQGVLTQQLIPTHDFKQRVVSSEILICTPAVQANIRNNKIHQIYSLIQAGRKYGMQTMNDDLVRLAHEGKITPDMALQKSTYPEEIRRLLNV